MLAKASIPAPLLSQSLRKRFIATELTKQPPGFSLTVLLRSESEEAVPNLSKQHLEFDVDDKTNKHQAVAAPVVHVDVDVLNPMITSVKKGARDIWIRLPAPVQQAAPYVAVGTTTGLLVWKIQSGRLKREVSPCLHHPPLQPSCQGKSADPSLLR